MELNPAPGSPIIPLNAPVLQAQGAQGLNTGAANTAPHGGSQLATGPPKPQSTLPLPVILPLTVSVPPSVPVTQPVRGRSRRGQRRSNRGKAAAGSTSTTTTAASPPTGMLTRPPVVPSIAVSPVPTAPPAVPSLTPQQVQQVEAMIERCLHLYMNQEEVMIALQIQANVSPVVTRHVWQGMASKNVEFFRAYEVRLKIKEQIMAFNYLVSQQAQVTEKNKALALTADNPAPSSSHMAPLFFSPFNPLSGVGLGFEPLPSPFGAPEPSSASFVPLTMSLSSLLTTVQPPANFLTSSMESALTLSTNSLINSFLKSSADSIFSGASSASFLVSSVDATSSSTSSSSSSSSSSSASTSSSSSDPSTFTAGSSSLSFTFGPPPATSSSSSSSSSSTASSLSTSPSSLFAASSVPPLLSSGAFAMPFISVDNMDSTSTAFSPFASFGSASSPSTAPTSLLTASLRSFGSSAGQQSTLLGEPSHLTGSNSIGSGVVSPMLSTSPTPDSLLAAPLTLTASTNALLDALSAGGSLSPLRLSPLTASTSGSLDGFLGFDGGSSDTSSSSSSSNTNNNASGQ